MSHWGMIVIGLIYAGCAYDQYSIGNIGTSIAFAGWSIGQMGMAYAVFR